MQNIPTHPKDQKKEHIYRPLKQWTTADLQESPDHSVTLQNGLGKPYLGAKKQRDSS